MKIGSRSLHGAHFLRPRSFCDMEGMATLSKQAGLCCNGSIPLAGEEHKEGGGQASSQCLLALLTD